MMRTGAVFALLASLGVPLSAQAGRGGGGFGPAPSSAEAPRSIDRVFIKDGFEIHFQGDAVGLAEIQAHDFTRYSKYLTPGDPRPVQLWFEPEPVVSQTQGWFFVAGLKQIKFPNQERAIQNDSSARWAEGLRALLNLQTERSAVVERGPFEIHYRGPVDGLLDVQDTDWTMFESGLPKRVYQPGESIHSKIRLEFAPNTFGGHSYLQAVHMDGKAFPQKPEGSWKDALVATLKDKVKTFTPPVTPHSIWEPETRVAAGGLKSRWNRPFFGEKYRKKGTYLDTQIVFPWDGLWKIWMDDIHSDFEVALKAKFGANFDESKKFSLTIHGSGEKQRVSFKPDSIFRLRSPDGRTAELLAGKLNQDQIVAALVNYLDAPIPAPAVVAEETERFRSFLSRLAFDAAEDADRQILEDFLKNVRPATKIRNPKEAQQAYDRLQADKARFTQEISGHLALDLKASEREFNRLFPKLEEPLILPMDQKSQTLLEAIGPTLYSPNTTDFLHQAVRDGKKVYLRLEAAPKIEVSKTQKMGTITVHGSLYVESADHTLEIPFQTVVAHREKTLDQALHKKNWVEPLVSSLDEQTGRVLALASRTPTRIATEPRAHAADESPCSHVLGQTLKMIQYR